MSESWTDTARTVHRWRQTRLPHALFVPAAAVLALASLVCVDLSVVPLLARTAVAYGALGALRLWDDLEDRAADHRAHPGRVDLRESPERLAAIVALVAAGVALWSPVGFGALYAALFVFYRARSAPLEAVLVLKYPALVALLGVALEGPGWAAMVGVYGAMLLEGRLGSRAGRAALLTGVAVGLVALRAVAR